MLSLLLTLFVLVITAAITIGEHFISDKKKKWALSILAVLLLGISGYLAFQANKENKSMAETAKENDKILKDAKLQLDRQTAIVKSGFENLDTKLIAEGANSTSIISSLDDLKAKVFQFVDSSNSYVSRILDVSKTSTLPPSPDPPPVLEPSDRQYINIPVGDKTSKFIDSKNQFAMSNETPNAKGQIEIIMNNYKSLLAPGETTGFWNDKKKKSQLVYLGRKDNTFNFYAREN